MQIIKTSIIAAVLVVSTATVRGWQHTTSASPRLMITPLTVCDVLSGLHKHNGRLVAIVGRISGQMFDGSWMYFEDCGPASSAGTPRWEPVVFLGCSAGERPPSTEGVAIDQAALEKQIQLLREREHLRSPELPEPDLGGKPGVPARDRWSVVVGRLTAAPTGKGGFGAIRARARLCSNPNSVISLGN